MHTLASALFCDVTHNTHSSVAPRYMRDLTYSHGYQRLVVNELGVDRNRMYEVVMIVAVAHAYGDYVTGHYTGPTGGQTDGGLEVMLTDNTWSCDDTLLEWVGVILGWNLGIGGEDGWEVMLMDGCRNNVGCDFWMGLVVDLENVEDGIWKDEIGLNWDYRLRATDVVAYSRRFQQLALMCSRMFPEEIDKIEKYISGLPDIILGIHKRKRKYDDLSKNNQNQQQQNKRQNTGQAYTTGNSDRKPYAGSKPLCSKCNYNHEGPCPPRCNNCKRVGHPDQRL
ncbi:hypothetical protein Tco_0942206 [Tanacetum coccineum]